MNEEFEKYKNERLSEHIDPQVLFATKTAFAAGQAAERRECALIAQSYQIVRCRSSYDDAVDKTANSIKEDIMDRGTTC